MNYQELQQTIKDTLVPMLNEEIAKLNTSISDANAKYQTEYATQLEEERKKREEVMEQYQKTLEELAKIPDKKAEMLETSKSNKDHKFTGFDHFCYDIIKAGDTFADASAELREWRKVSQEKAAGDPSQNIGEAEAGGVLIPTEYSTMLLERATARSSLLQRATIIPMANKSIEIPLVNSFDESQGLIDGGVLWYWKGEEKQYAESAAKFGTVALDLNKCTGLAFLTDEIIRWSRPSIGPVIERSFDRGLQRAMMRGFVRGTGVNQPQGFLSSNACIEVAKEDGQFADTVVIENIAGMYERLYSADDNMVSGIWYASRTIMKELLLMSLSVGLGGSAVFLINNQLQEQPNMRLLGLPLEISSQMSKKGDSGDIVLAEPSQYLIGQPVGGGSEMAQSIHLKFDYGQTAFRFTFWMDGKVWWPSEFTPERGDNQAPFVKLADRA